MKPLQASSGDLTADRRADFAEMLFASGEPAQAAELLLGALERAPQWAAGWFRLGEMQEAAGLLAQAAQAWAMALELEPTDRLGAALKLQLIGHAPAAAAPPSAFVETLFDHYADSFEESLVAKLGYGLPDVLCRAIRDARPGRFRLALDLGCGTGLMGERLRRSSTGWRATTFRPACCGRRKPKASTTAWPGPIFSILLMTAPRPISWSRPTCSSISARSNASSVRWQACLPRTAYSPSRSRRLPTTMGISRCSRRDATRIPRTMCGACFPAPG